MTRRILPAVGNPGQQRKRLKILVYTYSKSIQNVGQSFHFEVCLEIWCGANKYATK